jgi:hypothetical protein
VAQVEGSWGRLSAERGVPPTQGRNARKTSEAPAERDRRNGRRRGPPGNRRARLALLLEVFNPVFSPIYFHLLGSRQQCHCPAPENLKVRIITALASRVRGRSKLDHAARLSIAAKSEFTVTVNGHQGHWGVGDTMVANLGGYSSRDSRLKRIN